MGEEGSLNDEGRLVCVVPVPGEKTLHKLTEGMGGPHRCIAEAQSSEEPCSAPFVEVPLVSDAGTFRGADSAAKCPLEREEAAVIPALSCSRRRSPCMCLQLCHRLQMRGRGHNERAIWKTPRGVTDPRSSC